MDTVLMTVLLSPNGQPACWRRGPPDSEVGYSAKGELTGRGTDYKGEGSQ